MRLGLSGAAGNLVDTGDLDFDPSDGFVLDFKRVGGEIGRGDDKLYLWTQVVF